MNMSSARKPYFFMTTKPSSQPLSLFCPERERERIIDQKRKKETDIHTHPHREREREREI